MTARTILAVLLIACAGHPGTAFRAPEIAEWRRKRDELTTLLKAPWER